MSERHLSIERVITRYLQSRANKSELALRYKISVPWAKLINTNFIEDFEICFDEVIASNDVMFSTRVGYFMQKFNVSREVIYCVTRGRQNLTMQSNPEHFDSRVGVFIDRYQFLKTNLSDMDFDLLKLHGWDMVFWALRYKLGFGKALSTYTLLSKKGVKMWDKRFFNPRLVLNRLIGHYNKYRKTKEYINVFERKN